MMYVAESKALQKLYLGRIASKQYKIAQKAMLLSLIVTKIKMIIPLKADDTPDFCCATLLRNLLRSKVARSATTPNAAVTKR